MHAFYGTDVKTNEEWENHQRAQREYLDRLNAEQNAVKVQSSAAAANAFYGIDEVKKEKVVAKLGEPIPGYSGVNRRVQADNVFGMTYAEARRMASESLNKIDQEKSETLRETSKWVPEHQRK